MKGTETQQSDNAVSKIKAESPVFTWGTAGWRQGWTNISAYRSVMYTPIDLRWFMIILDLGTTGAHLGWPDSRPSQDSRIREAVEDQSARGE